MIIKTSIISDLEINSLEDLHKLKPIMGATNCQTANWQHGLEGRYSNGIGDAILADVEKEFKRVCAKYGLDCQGNIKVANPGQGSKFCTGVTG